MGPQRGQWCRPESSLYAVLPFISAIAALYGATSMLYACNFIHHTFRELRWSAPATWMVSGGCLATRLPSIYIGFQLPCGLLTLPHIPLGTHTCLFVLFKSSFAFQSLLVFSWKPFLRTTSSTFTLFIISHVLAGGRRHDAESTRIFSAKKRRWQNPSRTYTHWKG